MYRARDLVAENPVYYFAHFSRRVILLISGSPFRPSLCHCTHLLLVPLITIQLTS